MHMESTHDRSLGWTRRDIAATFQRMLQERYETVGREVRRLRLSQGLTHETLAFKAGVSVKTISRVENGRLHEHRGGTYRKIAEALGIDVQVLLAPIFTSPTAGDRAPLADQEVDRLGLDSRTDGRDDGDPPAEGTG